MEDAFIIRGGKTLKGEVKLSGAKNIALKVIICSLMFEQEVILNNIPKINDVIELLHLIRQLGAKAYFVKKNSICIDGRSLKSNRVDLLHASKIRVSYMLFAPLLKKFSSCYLPNPGGCRIGARPIDRIISGMKQLGLDVVYQPSSGYYYAQMKNQPAGYFRFSKPSHTGTELLIMLSLLGKDKITIDEAAQEPEIDELVDFLTKAGAKIKRNQKKIEIWPAKTLRLPSTFTISADRNEAVTFAVLALATKGEIIIHPILPSKIETFIKKIREVNGGFDELTKNKLKFYYQGPLKSSFIQTSPHPGFMTDWQPNWAVLMTQAQGDSIINERVFENRFGYVEQLRKLGAKIDFVNMSYPKPEKYFFFNFDPLKKYQQSIKITGGRKLHGGVLNITDLRAGATLAIAALVAQGESIINGASILERGYENFVEKIKKLGGSIKKI